eukprot:1441211-Prymnesium_polylepis.1
MQHGCPLPWVARSPPSLFAAITRPSCAGADPPEELAACVRGLRKRLGGQKSDALAAALEAEPPALAEVADALLEHYYDGMYNHQARRRAPPLAAPPLAPFARPTMG